MLALAVFIILTFAAVILFVNYGKRNVDQRANQAASAPSGLEKIENALHQFVASQKRLPCPAKPTTISGTEAFTGTTDACSAPDGVVPWGSLGLTAGDALDTWGRRISYRVFSGMTGFTRPSGLDASNCNTSAFLNPAQPVTPTTDCAAPFHETKLSDFIANKGISVNDRGTVINKVAYVLISHGSSGYGSYGNDFGGARAPLPNALSKELPNTQVPADLTYWKQDASAASVAATDATHFDDVLLYQTSAELLNDAKLSGRNWGTLSVSQSFVPPSVPLGTQSTLTIMLTNNAPLPVDLYRGVVDVFPAALQVSSASTTCTGGTFAISGSTISLSPTMQIPAQIGAVPGSCTVTVVLNTTATGPQAHPYSIEATPNPTAPLTPTDAAAIRSYIPSNAMLTVI